MHGPPLQSAGFVDRQRRAAGRVPDFSPALPKASLPYMTRLEDRLRTILRHAPGRMEALAAVAKVKLPQGAIGAGFVRSAVWDALTGRQATPVDDIDVLYLDPGDVSRDTEIRIEHTLDGILPGLPWSVRNQARMHTRNGDLPYHSMEDALRHWLETPTAVAVRLLARDDFEIVAPFGLDDLFAMRISPTPRGRERAAEYRKRIETRGWRAKWPEAEIELP